MKATLFILAFACCLQASAQDFQYPHYNIDSIIRIALRDTIGHDSLRHKEVIDYCAKLEKYGNKKEFMIPYVKFDKVLLCDIKDFDIEEYLNSPIDCLRELDKKCLKKGIRLNKEQTERLLYLVNNPLYYDWIVCGMPNLDYEYVFLNKKNDVLTRLFIKCKFETVILLESHGQSFPMKYGAFFKGKEELKKLVMEIEKR